MSISISIISFPGFKKKICIKLKLNFSYSSTYTTLFIHKNLTDLQYKTYGTEKAVIAKQQSIYKKNDIFFQSAYYFFIDHSSEIRDLCLMKLFSEALQNLPYFWGKNPK